MEDKLLELIRLKNKHITILQTAIANNAAFLYLHGIRQDPKLVEEVKQVTNDIKQKEQEIRIHKPT